MTVEERGALPAFFRVQIEDESMSPRVRVGAFVSFSRDAEPKPGDGVLVRDKAGGLHLRVYRSGRPGEWEAHAENKDYRPLESERDGLRVMAVLISVEARWA